MEVVISNEWRWLLIARVMFGVVVLLLVAWAAQGGFSPYTGDGHIGEASHPGPPAPSRDWLKSTGQQTIKEGTTHVGNTFKQAWADNDFVQKVSRSKPKTDNVKALKLYFQIKLQKEELTSIHGAAASGSADSPAQDVPATAQFQIVPHTASQPATPARQAAGIGIQPSAPAAVTTIFTTMLKQRGTEVARKFTEFLFSRSSLMLLLLLIVLPGLMAAIVAAVACIAIKGIGTFCGTLSGLLAQAIATSANNWASGLTNIQDQISSSMLGVATMGLAGDCKGYSGKVDSMTDPLAPTQPSPLVTLCTQVWTLLLAFFAGVKYAGATGGNGS